MKKILLTLAIFGSLNASSEEFFEYENENQKLFDDIQEMREVLFLYEEISDLFFQKMHDTLGEIRDGLESIEKTK